MSNPTTEAWNATLSLPSDAVAALRAVCDAAQPQPKQRDQPMSMTRFSTGAVRSSDADDVRYDLITPIGLRRLAETCAEGARKYGDHNWQKGIPASVMLNHAIRHIYMYLQGDESEDHLAHAAWNILGVCHFEEVMPEMIDVFRTKAAPDTQAAGD